MLVEGTRSAGDIEIFSPARKLKLNLNLGSLGELGQISRFGRPRQLTERQTLLNQMRRAFPKATRSSFFREALPMISTVGPAPPPKRPRCR